ncbi:4Fe-4S binding protein [bacterium]|jgi:ferredoxin|nr:4Fe-4S binding protein [bacterium]MBT4292675.1 4Fe-4S binding protein [bacterium]MBT7311789.1 4Fe-4S binding protein [bacterium]
MPALVNPEECTGCEACVEECPTECITMSGDVALVDPEECTDCEACVEVCPTECITMVD